MYLTRTRRRSPSIHALLVLVLVLLLPLLLTLPPPPLLLLWLAPWLLLLPLTLLSSTAAGEPGRSARISSPALISKKVMGAARMNMGRLFMPQYSNHPTFLCHTVSEWCS